MDKRDFQLEDIEELRGQQNQFNRIKRVSGEKLFHKTLGVFPDTRSALAYVANTPGNRDDSLSPFIPETKYTIKQVGDAFQVIALAEEINGKRLDELKEIPTDVLPQLDAFFSKSLEIFESEGICPGMNLRNFVVNQDKLYYVDSEPYPPYNIELFEMAHAREQKLTKLFGPHAKEIFPLTWKWIEDHRPEHYQKAKSEARKRRRG